MATSRPPASAAPGLIRRPLPLGGCPTAPGL